MAFVAFALLSVPLAGGHLARLSEVRLRGGWVVAAALALQVVIISVVPDGLAGVHAVLHVGTYVTGLAFVAVNLRVRGMWLVAVGGALNFMVIVANGGVMPASRAALRAAGRSSGAGSFTNSGSLAHARLAFLGDVFSLPSSWPLHNVFSIGDVVLALGVAVVLHQACGTWLTGAGRAARFGGHASTSPTRP